MKNNILDQIPVLKFQKSILYGYYIADENGTVYYNYAIWVSDSNSASIRNYTMDKDDLLKMEPFDYNDPYRDRCFGIHYQRTMNKEQKRLIEPYIPLIMSLLH